MTIESEVKQALGPEWSEEDKDWLETKVPEGLKTVALRHGRALYTHTMHCGAVNYAVGVIARQTRGNQAVARALHVLTTALNQLATDSLPPGKSLKDFAECRMDVERVVALAEGGKAVPEGARVSKGGIILNS